MPKKPVMMEFPTDPNNSGTQDQVAINYLTDPKKRMRPRVVVSGNQGEDDAAVINRLPEADEYGLVVRPLPSIGHAGTDLLVFGVASTPAIGALTTVTSWTCPIGKRGYVFAVQAASNVHCKFSVELNGHTILRSWATAAQPNPVMSFGGQSIEVSEGQTIRLRAMHGENSFTPEFSGTVIGRLVTLAD